MGCCGQGKKTTVKPNSKLCSQCGWVMNRVHKYNPAKKAMQRYWVCTNKTYRQGHPCGHKEDIK